MAYKAKNCKWKYAAAKAQKEYAPKNKIEMLNFLSQNAPKKKP